MFKKINKTYRFALLTAAYLSIILMFILGIFLQGISGFNLWYIFVFGISFFGICFALIQFRLERFINKRIKIMYDDISLLDATSFSQKSISTDMETLTAELGRFAENKKLKSRP